MIETVVHHLTDPRGATVCLREDRAVPDPGQGHTCAILLHGMFSSSQGNKIRSLGELLARQGVTALRPDFIARGDSPGVDRDICMSAQLANLAAVKAHAEATLAPARYVLMGSSFGALTALLSLYAGPDNHAALFRQDELLALVLVALPHRTDFTTGLLPNRESAAAFEKAGFVRYQGHDIDYRMHRELLGYPSVAGMLSGVEIPTLLIHGEADGLFPAHEVAALLDLSPAAVKEMVVVPGADHRIDEPAYRAQLLEAVMRFLEPLL